MNFNREQMKLELKLAPKVGTSENLVRAAREGSLVVDSNSHLKTKENVKHEFPFVLIIYLKVLVL